MIIYKATNKINGKCYIGQTKRKLEVRIKEHFRTKYNKYFHNGLVKYGPDNFKWTILEVCMDQEELDEKEQYYIQHFNSITPNGYNICKGGSGNFTYKSSNKKKSKSHKKKISEAEKGNKNHFYGKKHSEEAKLKMKEAWIRRRNTN